MTVDGPSGPVAVTTAHLSFVPWRGRRQLATLARFAVADADVPAAVLLGDLNLPPQVAIVRARSSAVQAPAGPTFPTWKPIAQLDHLFVRGTAELADLRVGAPGPSDHLPLCATVHARVATNGHAS